MDETPNTDRNDSFSTRIDHQFRNQSQFSARYTYNGEQNVISGSFPLRPTEENVRAQQAALSYTYARASWLNEARLSFSRMSMYDTPQSAFQTNVIQQLGIEGLPSTPANYGLPYFQLADYSLVTDDPTLPQIQRDNLWNVSDSVSWTRGAHTIKTGFDWIHFQLNYQQNQMARGSFTYTGAFTSADGVPGATGDAMADFLLGFPQNTSRDVGNTQAYMRQNSFAGFIQDDWRVSSAADPELRAALRVCHALYGNSRRSAEPGVCGRAESAAPATGTSEPGGAPGYAELRAARGTRLEASEAAVLERRDRFPRGIRHLL